MLAGEEELTVADNELLGRYLVKGDGEALEQLVRRHSALVMGVCRNLLLHRQDAEDAFQATFLVLARKASKLTSRGSIAGWLYQVAVRNCLQLRRKKGRARETEMVEEPQTSADEPWLSISHAQESDTVHSEIKRLPERYREVIVLCHIQGYSRQRAAEMLNTSEQSVKAALARGRNLLRRRLVKQGIVLTAVLAMMRTSTAYASENVSQTLLDSTLQICSAAATSSVTTGPSPGEPGGIPEVIQQLASSGAGMSTSMITKVVVVTILFCGAVTIPASIFGHNSQGEDAVRFDLAAATTGATSASEESSFVAFAAGVARVVDQDSSTTAGSAVEDEVDSSGDPFAEVAPGNASPFDDSADNPFGENSSPFGDEDPFADDGTDPFGAGSTSGDQEGGGGVVSGAGSQTPDGDGFADAGITTVDERQQMLRTEADQARQNLDRLLEQQKLVVQQQQDEINRLNAYVRELQNAAETFRVENDNLKQALNDFRQQAAGSNAVANQVSAADTADSPADGNASNVNDVVTSSQMTADEGIAGSFAVTDSTEYWELMRQSYLARMEAEERSLTVIGPENEKIKARARIFEWQARIIEAGLNIDRIENGIPSSGTTSGTPAVNIPPASDKVVEPGDRLRIEVMTDSTFNRIVTVAADHTISIPFAGVINVEGMTPEQVSEKVAVGLARFIQLEPTAVFITYAGTSEPAGG